MSNLDAHNPCNCMKCQIERAAKHSGQCCVCGADTRVVLGINLRAVNVCNDCCLNITRQTVQSLTVRSLEVPFE